MRNFLLASSLLIAGCGGGGGADPQLDTVNGPTKKILVGDHEGGKIASVDLESGLATVLVSGIAPDTVGNIALSPDRKIAYFSMGLSEVYRADLTTGSKSVITEEYNGIFGGLAVVPGGNVYWFGTDTDVGVSPPRRWGATTYYVEGGGANPPVRTTNRRCAAATMPSTGDLLVAREPNETNGSVMFETLRPASGSLANILGANFADASHRCYRDISVSNTTSTVAWAASNDAQELTRYAASGVPIFQIIEFPRMPSSENIGYVAVESHNFTALVTTSAALYRVDLLAGRSQRLFTAAQLGLSKLTDIVILE